jgi:hypothetical protein
VLPLVSRCRWVALVACLTTCLPPLTSPEGLACNDAKPCPDDFFCVDEVCRATRPPPMEPAPLRLFTDACEVRPTAYSSPTSNTLFVALTPRSSADGGASACVVSGEGTDGVDFGVRLQGTLLVVNGRYCASAVVGAGTAGPTPRVTLLLESLRANQTTVEASPPAVFVPDAGPGYRLLRTSLRVDADAGIVSGVRVTLAGPLERRATFAFDDLQVTVVSGDAGCPP